MYHCFAGLDSSYQSYYERTGRVFEINQSICEIVFLSRKRKLPVSIVPWHKTLMDNWQIVPYWFVLANMQLGQCNEQNIQLYCLLDSLVIECWLRVWEVPGSIPSEGLRHTLTNCLALNIKRERLDVSKVFKILKQQIAKIPSLRALWKINYNKFPRKILSKQNNKNDVKTNI